MAQAARGSTRNDLYKDVDLTTLFPFFIIQKLGHIYRPILSVIGNNFTRVFHCCHMPMSMH